MEFHSLHPAFNFVNDVPNAILNSWLLNLRSFLSARKV